MSEKEMDLAKSMDQVLAEMETQAQDFDADPPKQEEEEIDKGLTFDLFKSDDFDYGDGASLDVESLVKSFGEVADRNTLRLARATEQLLNATRAQSHLLKDQNERLEKALDIIERLGATPEKPASARTVQQAEEMAKSLETKPLGETEDPLFKGEKVEVLFQQVAPQVLSALQTAWKEADKGSKLHKALGEDIVRLNSVSIPVPLVKIMEHVSVQGQEVIKQIKVN